MITNFEKNKKVLLDFIKNDAAFSVNVNNEICSCCKAKCSHCNVGTCSTAKEMLEWLLQPVFPTLTSFEKEFLQKIHDAGSNWLVYDKKYKVLFFCEDEPVFDEGFGNWVDCGNLVELPGFENDFTFVRTEDNEKFNIEELLNNCQVIEK